MSTRRNVGAYEWRNELDKLKRKSEQLRIGLVELSRDARTVEATRQYLQLVSLSSEIEVKALELKDYKP